VGVVSDWEVICGWHWRKLVEERPASIDAWSARHLDTLTGLEAEAPAAATGNTLLHLDLRADNLLLTPEDRVLVVDWPHARVGASWIDAVFFAPSVAMQGGPWPEALVAKHPHVRHVDPEAITAVVAAVAPGSSPGRVGPRPASPGLPTLRPFQASQGEVARGWLAHRTGLR